MILQLQRICLGLLLIFMMIHLRYIQSTCATSGEGLYEGLDWLSNNIASKVCSKSPYDLLDTLWIVACIVSLGPSLELDNRIRKNLHELVSEFFLGKKMRSHLFPPFLRPSGLRTCC